MARQVFIRFKALLMEPSAFAYAERHDNIEAIYKKLNERRDTADVTELLKELHRIVNEAIRTQAPGDDQAEGLTFDLSQIDLEQAARRVRQEGAAQGDRASGHPRHRREKLAEMLARNPMRMDYQHEVRGDRRRLQPREGPDDDRGDLPPAGRAGEQPRRGAEARDARRASARTNSRCSTCCRRTTSAKADRERVKQASRELLAAIKARLAELDRFWEKEQTKADVEVFILDDVFASLPTPPFTPEEKKLVAENVYAHVWQQALSGEIGSSH